MFRAVRNSLVVHVTGYSYNIITLAKSFFIGLSYQCEDRISNETGVTELSMAPYQVSCKLNTSNTMWKYWHILQGIKVIFKEESDYGYLCVIFHVVCDLRNVKTKELYCYFQWAKAFAIVTAILKDMYIDLATVSCYCI